MPATSFYEIPSVIDDKNLLFIMKRLDIEQFPYVTCLTEQGKEKFRQILRDFFSMTITLNEAITQTSTEITPPITYKKINLWEESLVRSEVSKLFTLGYGDYLLSLGETDCFIPHTPEENNDECNRLIAGKRFPIKTIQDNIYKNYFLEVNIFPTVPLHANCQHIITKCAQQ